MKIKNTIALCAALAASGAILTACQADIDAPELRVPKADMVANTTIAQLKADFNDVETVGKIGVKPDGSHYIVHGRVVSCDASGNIYQEMVIQDQTAALDFSIGRASLYNIYPVGQEVVVDLTGMYIGKYGGLQRVGDFYQSGSTAQPGRMPYAKFANQSQLDGLPEHKVKYVEPGADYPADSQYCISFNSFDQLPSAGEELNLMMSQLVEFRNVRFEYRDPSLPNFNPDLTYAPYQETVNRNIIDEAGNKIAVRNSGYSSFYTTLLPEGTGTVRGILSYYGNTSDSPWQLLIRGLDDVIFTEKGQESDPYTVDELLALDNNGQTSWAKGYIVGAGKFGITTVSSPSDVVFGADGDIFPGNLLLAPEPGCTDLSQCVAVELPQGSQLRQYGNLLDNPGNLGKELTLKGTFRPYLGLHGIVGCPGTSVDFSIEGLVIPGSQRNPYDCAYVLANHQTQATGWFGGFIVGYIAGASYDSGAVFAPLASDTKNYSQRIVLGPTPDTTDPALCIVVDLRAKRDFFTQERLSALYRSRFAVQGTMGLQLGHPGVTSVTDYDY